MRHEPLRIGAVAMKSSAKVNPDAAMREGVERAVSTACAWGFGRLLVADEQSAGAVWRELRRTSQTRRWRDEVATNDRCIVDEFVIVRSAPPASAARRAGRRTPDDLARCLLHVGRSMVIGAVEQPASR